MMVVSVWAFTPRGGITLIRVMEKSGAMEVARSGIMTACTMYMDAVAIAESFRWRKDTGYESATIVTDSMSTLEKHHAVCRMERRNSKR